MCSAQRSPLRAARDSRPTPRPVAESEHRWWQTDLTHVCEMPPVPPKLARTARGPCGCSSSPSPRCSTASSTASCCRLGRSCRGWMPLHLHRQRLQQKPQQQPQQQRRLPPRWTGERLSLHVRPGASVLYVRDTRISLLRAIRTKGAGQLALKRHALYVRRTRISLGRAVRTAYRDTTGERWPSPASSRAALASPWRRRWASPRRSGGTSLPWATATTGEWARRSAVRSRLPCSRRT